MPQTHTHTHKNTVTWISTHKLICKSTLLEYQIHFIVTHVIHSSFVSYYHNIYAFKLFNQWQLGKVLSLRIRVNWFVDQKNNNNEANNKLWWCHNSTDVFVTTNYLDIEGILRNDDWIIDYGRFSPVDYINFDRMTMILTQILTLFGWGFDAGVFSKFNFINKVNNVIWVDFQFRLLLWMKMMVDEKHFQIKYWHFLCTTDMRVSFNNNVYFCENPN